MEPLEAICQDQDQNQMSKGLWSCIITDENRMLLPPQRCVKQSACLCGPGGAMSDTADVMSRPSQVWDLSFQIVPPSLLSRWVLVLAALLSLNDSGGLPLCTL